MTNVATTTVAKDGQTAVINTSDLPDWKAQGWDQAEIEVKDYTPSIEAYTVAELKALVNDIDGLELPSEITRKADIIAFIRDNTEEDDA